VKTMTCGQLGGPCELAHNGATADEVIKSQDRHLKDAVSTGDSTHEEALKAMKGRWRHPKRSMGWYKDVKSTFAALPEN
jgi:predicted small metal-binding protein